MSGALDPWLCVPDFRTGLPLFFAWFFRLESCPGRADPKILSFVYIVNFCRGIKTNAPIRVILSFFDYSAGKNAF